MTTGLSVRGLSAGYGEIKVVHEASFDVAPGEVVALLGPNGAGKTTTLLTMVGALRPTAGEILFDGEDITKKSTDAIARLGLALVPDNRGIFFDLTVHEHFQLAVARRNDGLIELMLERFPALKPLMGRKAGLLSGGEQQMLALGKALVTEPKILVIDEMSMGLAPIIVQSLMPIIRQAAEEDGMGVLLVEQHVEMALRVADRGVVLNRGRVHFEGSAADLLANRNEVEAAYLART